MDHAPSGDTRRREAATRSALSTNSTGTRGFATWGLLIAAIAGLVVASWLALLPFVIGGLLVYVLLPVVTLLERVLPRALAALCTLAGFCAAVAWLVYLLFPVLSVQVMRLYHTVRNPDSIAGMAMHLIRALRGVSEPAPSLLRDYLDQVNAAAREQVAAVIAGLATVRGARSLALVDTRGVLIGLLLRPLWLLVILFGQRSAGAPACPAGLDRRRPVRQARSVDYGPLSSMLASHGTHHRCGHAAPVALEATVAP